LWCSRVQSLDVVLQSGRAPVGDMRRSLISHVSIIRILLSGGFYNYL
jgi:hypothetical protein